MNIAGLVIAIITLIYLVYKGINALLSAVICSLVAGIFNGFGIWQTLTDYYVPGFANFFRSIMLIFIFASIYGKMMAVSGSATRIAYFFIDVFGKDKVILIIGLTTALLVYGGVSVFVVIFSILPIGIVLLEEANISKSLLPAIIAWGQETFAMTAIPGTPQLNNILPIAYLGTTTTAAPLLGWIATAIMFFGGYFYLKYSARKLQKQGKGFDASTLRAEDKKIMPREECPPIAYAIIPLAVLMVTYLLLQSGVAGFKMTTFNAINTGMCVAIVLIFALNRRKAKALVGAFSDGLTDWVMPLITLSSIIAFGSVVKSTEGFKILVDFALGLKVSVYISAFLATNILAGITGSASGGMGIAVEALADKWIAAGGNSAALHRIASVASTGLDSLPHCGGLNTTFQLCNEKMTDGYKYAFVVAALIPIIAGFIIALLAQAGVV